MRKFTFAAVTAYSDLNLKGMFLIFGLLKIFAHVS